MQVFPDFPAFITMFLWLFGLVFYFAEWMFRIADCFTDDFQRFGHSDFLLSGLARREGCQRAFLGKSPTVRSMIGIGCFKQFKYRTAPEKSHSKNV
jgi:hypothetical protein